MMEDQLHASHSHQRNIGGQLVHYGVQTSAGHGALFALSAVVVVLANHTYTLLNAQWT